MIDAALLNAASQHQSVLDPDLVFDDLRARQHTRNEMSIHLETLNRNALLEALARTGIDMLQAIYNDHNDGVRLENWVVGTAANVEITPDAICTVALVELAILGDDLKIVRIYTPIMEALKKYCSGTYRRNHCLDFVDNLVPDTFVFDVPNETIWHNRPSLTDTR